jgi:hypothetical protein
LRSKKLLPRVNPSAIASSKAKEVGGGRDSVRGLISIIRSSGIPEALAAARAVLNALACANKKEAFTAVNWYVNSSAENVGFAGLEKAQQIN